MEDSKDAELEERIALDSALLKALRAADELAKVVKKVAEGNLLSQEEASYVIRTYEETDFLRYYRRMK